MLQNMIEHRQRTSTDGAISLVLVHVFYTCNLSAYMAHTHGVAVHFNAADFVFITSMTEQAHIAIGILPVAC